MSTNNKMYVMKYDGSGLRVLTPTIKSYSLEDINIVNDDAIAFSGYGKINVVFSNGNTGNIELEDTTKNPWKN